MGGFLGRKVPEPAQKVQHTLQHPPSRPEDPRPFATHTRSRDFPRVSTPAARLCAKDCSWVFGPARDNWELGGFKGTLARGLWEVEAPPHGILAPRLAALTSPAATAEVGCDTGTPSLDGLSGLMAECCEKSVAIFLCDGVFLCVCRIVVTEREAPYVMLETSMGKV